MTLLLKRIGWGRGSSKQKCHGCVEVGGGVSIAPEVGIAIGGSRVRIEVGVKVGVE